MTPLGAAARLALAKGSRKPPKAGTTRPPPDSTHRAALGGGPFVFRRVSYVDVTDGAALSAGSGASPRSSSSASRDDHDHEALDRLQQALGRQVDHRDEREAVEGDR